MLNRVWPKYEGEDAILATIGVLVYVVWKMVTIIVIIYIYFKNNLRKKMLQIH